MHLIHSFSLGHKLGAPAEARDVEGACCCCGQQRVVVMVIQRDQAGQQTVRCIFVWPGKYGNGIRTIA